MTAIDQYLAATGFKEFRPKAALIDMDGTLYDSMPRHADAWMEMCRQAGLDAEHDEFFLHEGRTGAATIDILMRRTFGRPATDKEKKELYAIKSAAFAAMPPVDPMPGAARMLRTLADAGITRVLVTGSGQATLLNRLDSDFPGAFSPELRITSADVSRGKPDPEPYLRAMSMAGVEPWQSIVIENAPLGVQSGVAAKAFTVAVTTGPIPREAFVEAGASLIMPSMPDFADLLPTIL